MERELHVAEILSSLVAYVRGAGIDARWLVIEGSSVFFRITKRLHHALRGSKGEGSSPVRAPRSGILPAFIPLDALAR